MVTSLSNRKLGFLKNKKTSTETKKNHVFLDLKLTNNILYICFLSILISFIYFFTSINPAYSEIKVVVDSDNCTIKGSGGSKKVENCRTYINGKECNNVINNMSRETDAGYTLAWLCIRAKNILNKRFGERVYDKNNKYLGSCNDHLLRQYDLEGVSHFQNPLSYKKTTIKRISYSKEWYNYCIYKLENNLKEYNKNSIIPALERGKIWDNIWLATSLIVLSVIVFYVVKVIVVTVRATSAGISKAHRFIYTNVARHPAEKEVGRALDLGQPIDGPALKEALRHNPDGSKPPAAWKSEDMAKKAAALNRRIAEDTRLSKAALEREIAREQLEWEKKNGRDRKR